MSVPILQSDATLGTRRRDAMETIPPVSSNILLSPKAEAHVLGEWMDNVEVVKTMVGKC